VPTSSLGGHPSTRVQASLTATKRRLAVEDREHAAGVGEELLEGLQAELGARHDRCRPGGTPELSVMSLSVKIGADVLAGAADAVRHTPTSSAQTPPNLSARDRRRTAGPADASRVDKIGRWSCAPARG
jgi:hypothetical protein